MEFKSFISGSPGSGIKEYVEAGARKYNLTVKSISAQTTGGFFNREERVDFTLEGTESNLIGFKRQVISDVRTFNS